MICGAAMVMTGCTVVQVMTVLCTVALGTTQSAIARLEGGQVSPSFATLHRYAEATGTRPTVGLERISG